MMSPHDGSRLGAPHASSVRPDGEALQNYLRDPCDGVEESGTARIPWGPLLLIATGSILALGLSDRAFGQEATLPEITVEAGQPARTVTRRATPRPAVPPQPVEPVAADSLELNDTEIISPAEVPYYTPASVSVAGRGEIETFGSDQLDNVFRAMPGTFTRESEGNPGLAVNIRGFEGSGRVNTMIDGVRQNFRFTGHEAQGFTYVDPLLVAGIDVQRGAVSTAGGAGALAGTANIRTLDVQDILRQGQNYGALTHVGWGSNGVGWAEMGAGAARAGKVSVAGAISKHDEKNYENGEGLTVPNTGEDLISGLAKAHIDISPGQRLSFGTVLYNNDFTANSYEQSVKSNTYYSNYVYNPAANDLVDFRANLYFNDVEMNYEDGYVPGLSNIGRVIEDNGWGFDTSNTSRFSMGTIDVATVYGVEYFKDDVSVINSATQPDFGVNPSGESDIFSLFSQTTFSKGIWDLIAGVRYDRYTVDGVGSVAPFNPVGVPPGQYVVDREEGKVLPDITLAAQVTPWMQPYVTYSETMRAPTVNELLTGGAHPGDGPTQSFFPNPYLEPETAKGWEAGANFVFENAMLANDRLLFKANYYHLNVDNYITACFPTVGFGVYFCNAPGTSEVNGVELEGIYDAGWAFGQMAYTYTHTDLPEQINGFGANSYLPDHMLVLTGGVRLMDEQMTLGARAYFYSDAPLGEFNVAPGDPTELPGYELMDLFASYAVTENLDLNMTIQNLFDRTYTPALATGATGAPAGLATGRGRTFLLSARAQF